MQDLQSSVVLLLWMIFSGQGQTAPAPCPIVQSSSVQLRKTGPGISRTKTAEDSTLVFGDTSGNDDRTFKTEDPVRELSPE